MPFRTIVNDGGWPNDPDWLGDLETDDPDDAICFGLSGRRAASQGTPMRDAVIYFAAVDADEKQVAGTATIQVFIINGAEHYGLKPDARGIRHPSTLEFTNYDLMDPLTFTVTKHERVCLRVTDITSDATEIRCSVQEMQ